MPALVEAIKTAGLVLVSDITNKQDAHEMSGMNDIPEGLDGVLENNAVLRFNESIDM